MNGKKPKQYANGRDFLMDALNSETLCEKEKVKVAIALFRTEKRNTGRPGKKEEATDAATNAATGKFAVPEGPKLGKNGSS